MNRLTYEIPKTTWGLRSKARKIGVHKLPPSMVTRRRVLILGSGRCGTTTLARMLTAAGLDVKHEKVGAAGTSSLYFTVDSAWYPAWPWYKDRVHVGERRSDFVFDYVIQVVRHPLHTIPSMQAIFPALNYDFFECNGIIPSGIKSQLARCMHAYYNLNVRAESQADIWFRINKLPHMWPALQRRLDFDGPMPELVFANKATGFRKREPLHWDDLYAADRMLGSMIKRMAARYGFNT